MNFDIEKAKRLINIFGNLNADNQEALLVEASRLEINQGLKDQVVKSGKPVTEENLGKATDRFIKVMNPLMDHWDDMGNFGVMTVTPKSQPAIPHLFLFTFLGHIYLHRRIPKSILRITLDTTKLFSLLVMKLEILSYSNGCSKSVMHLFVTSNST